MKGFITMIFERGDRTVHGSSATGDNEMGWRDGGEEESDDNN